MKNIIILLTIILLSANAFAGDLLVLTDNSSFEGKVKSFTDCTIEFKFDNKKYIIPASKIAILKLEKQHKKLNTQYLKMVPDTFSVGDEETCIKAQDDAQLLHYTNLNKFLNVLYGMALPGISQLLGTIYINPKFEDAKFMHLSENKVLHNDANYLKCYIKRAKSERMAMRLFGTGITLLLTLGALTLIK